MSTTEPILEKASALPPEQQATVLQFVESLSQRTPPKSGQPGDWLEVALNANLQGPPDWSEHLDDYLYRDTPHGL